MLEGNEGGPHRKTPRVYVERKRKVQVASLYEMIERRECGSVLVIKKAQEEKKGRALPYERKTPNGLLEMTEDENVIPDRLFRYVEHKPPKFWKARSERLEKLRKKIQKQKLSYRITERVNPDVKMERRNQRAKANSMSITEDDDLSTSTRQPPPTLTVVICDD